MTEDEEQSNSETEDYDFDGDNEGTAPLGELDGPPLQLFSDEDPVAQQQGDEQLNPVPLSHDESAQSIQSLIEESDELDLVGDQQGSQDIVNWLAQVNEATGGLFTALDYTKDPKWRLEEIKEKYYNALFMPERTGKASLQCESISSYICILTRQISARNTS